MTPRVTSRFLDLHALAALDHMRFTTQRRVEGTFMGCHSSRQLGGAGEFVDFREYTGAEDLRRLDWKVLARTGKAFVRIHEEETNLTCALVIDASGSMRFGAADRRSAAGSKLEYVQYLATALSHVISRTQDHVGLAVLDGTLREWLAPGVTSAHVEHLQQVIEGLATHPNPRMAEGLRDLFERCRRRGVLLLTSDFLMEDIEEVFAALRLFRHRGWDIVVLHVVHPDEERLPQGVAYRFEGMENDGRVNCSPAEISAAYRERFAAHLAMVRQLSLAGGCEYRRISTAIPYLQTLGGFFGGESGVTQSQPLAASHNLVRLRFRKARPPVAALHIMTFLHPWAILIGVVAAAGPVLIHWLTRPRPVRLPLSTLRFVREAVHQQKTWHRLRDIVLLCLRTLAVLLIALAVARPQWGQQAQVSDIQASDAVRVVILDVSQSMAARAGAVEQLERARTVAANYLRYRPGLAANLILAGARPRGVFDGPSTNFDALRDELARCRALPQRFDVNRALDMAARMLAPANDNDTRRRELVVVSDFQRTSWATANFAPLPKDTHIQFESTSAADAVTKPPANLAILRVDGHTAGAQGSTQLDVEVGNYSPTAREVTVEVALGNSTWRLTGLCAAGQTTLTQELGVRKPGWQAGEARLVGVDDALAADNVCPFVLQVRQQPTFVLMTRQTKARKPTSSLFLECALAPTARTGGKYNGKRDNQSPLVVRMDPAANDNAALAAGDLILLDHPGRLADETVKLLAELLHRGRPLLYVASELVDATNLKRLREVAGNSLQMPVEFTPPPAGQTRRDLFLTSMRRDSPAFGVFGDGLTAMTSRLRFAGGLGSRRLNTGVDADVLAGYNDGSAAVVLCSSGAGELAVINADLAVSNLPKTSAFVPLLAELVEQMLDRRRGSGSITCGDPLTAHLSAEAGAAAGLRIRGPEDQPDSRVSADTKVGTVPGGRHGELADEAAGVAWRWTTPGPVGVYSVERDGTPVFALAATIPAEESNLETLKPDVLRERLAAGLATAYHGAVDEGQQRDDFWKWCAVACVVCMLGEISALLFFRT